LYKPTPYPFEKNPGSSGAEIQEPVPQLGKIEVAVFRSFGVVKVGAMGKTHDFCRNLA